jgi:hypothetical protein
MLMPIAIMIILVTSSILMELQQRRHQDKSQRQHPKPVQLVR